MRIALQLACLLTLGFAALGWSSCRDSSASSGAPTATESQAAAPTAAESKDVLLAGVDTSAMTPRERHAWSGLVTELFAPCPSVPASIAQCIQEKRSCGSCALAAKWVASAVRNGASDEQVRRAYKERFDPGSVRVIPVDGSPTKGPDDAPVTIVELADFECPHCKEAVPAIDAVMAAHPGKVRLVYKSYTLPFHTRGEPAARAAFAAAQQGKFWEMEHLLFERQQHLEDADLDRYAKMLGLDLARFKADMDSPPIKSHIAADHKLGEALKVKGTPTIFVNGRELDIEAEEPLEARVASELGVPPVTPLAPSAGAAPAPSTGAADSPSTAPR